MLYGKIVLKGMWRKAWLFVVWLCTWGGAWAQHMAEQRFVALPTVEYPVGRAFEARLAGATSVRLDYPELVPLTRAEVRRVEELGLELGTMPTAETYLGMERKQPVLDLRIIPLVVREGKYFRATSVRITPLNESKALRARMPGKAPASGRYAEHSRLATGHWQKICVEQEGVYRLTDATLRSWGFTKPEQVRLYGYGGRALAEQAVFTGSDMWLDDVCEVPMWRTEGGWLFFAEGVIRWQWLEAEQQWSHSQSPYSLRSYYFLTEGEGGMDFPVADESGTVAEQTDAVWHYGVLDRDAFAWFGGGRNFADSHDYSTGSGPTYQLATPNVVAGEEARLDIAFTSAGQTSSTAVQVKLNGEQIGSLTLPAYADNESAREAVRDFTTTALQPENKLTFTVNGSNPARLDYVRATYRMRLTAANGGTSFSPCKEGAVTLRVTGASSSTQLWQVGEGGVPTRRMTTTLGSDGVMVCTVSDGTARYVMVDANKEYATPTLVGTVANQDLHGDHEAYDMVVIVPQSGKLDAEAERLAAYHREADGLRVKVVRADAIYNEFSSGTPDATAYRRYVKMLYDRAQTDEDMPRYLLFFGDCFFDNRGVTAEGRAEQLNDYLLSFEPGTGSMTDFSIGTLASYATDDYFALLDDGEGVSLAREKTDLAVGRLPVHDSETARLMVDKIIAYGKGENPGAWRNRLIFAGDDIDNNMHMRGAESALEESLRGAGSVVAKRIYPDATRRMAAATHVYYPEATKRMLTEMDRGALMFNYTGHGGTTQISHARLLTKEDFAEHAGEHPALWVFAACEITPYDQQEDDLGRILLASPQGGAIALMCSSRAVYASYNSALNDAFCRFVFAKDAKGKRYTMGEALQRCKNDLITTGRDATNNKLKYVLLGDPALVLRLPTGSVVLDSINGQLLKPSSFVQLKAGEVVRLSGHIADAPTFKGTLTATLFDREETITCLNNAGTADTPMTYKERTSQLYEGTDSVRDGKFTIQMIIPRAISYSDDDARLVFYAVNEDYTLECHGETTQFCLNGSAAGLDADNEGPVVVPYLGDPDFVYGGVVPSTVMLGATIHDESGINTTSRSVGHDIELVIDGNTADTRILNDYFQYDFGSYNTGTIAYPLTGLAEGRHTLTLRVWDVLDNSTVATLSFVVKDGGGNKLSLFPATNPTKASTRLVVQGINTESAEPVVLRAYDVAGRMLWTQTLPADGKAYATTTWPLTTNAGGPVTAGMYILRATQGDTESEGAKLIVLGR